MGELNEEGILELIIGGESESAEFKTALWFKSGKGY